MGGQAIDEVGHRYGRLVITERAVNKKGNYAAWLCKCDCGNDTVVAGGSLRSGDTKSCGCLSREMGGYRQFKDELGSRYGRLAVIKRIRANKNRGAYWLCRCDCGNEVEVFGNNLRRGVTKSCGCFRKEKISELRSLPIGEAAFNVLFGHFKYSAEHRGYEWQLTKEQVRTLTQQSCYYCGILPIQCGTSSVSYNGAYLYNGIDRIDNDLGYVIDNVVSSCKKCNYAKRKMQQNEFLTWISQVYEYSVSKEK